MCVRCSVRSVQCSVRSVQCSVRSVGVVSVVFGVVEGLFTLYLVCVSAVCYSPIDICVVLVHMQHWRALFTARSTSNNSLRKREIMMKDLGENNTRRNGQRKMKQLELLKWLDKCCQSNTHKVTNVNQCNVVIWSHMYM